MARPGDEFPDQRGQAEGDGFLRPYGHPQQHAQEPKVLPLSRRTLAAATFTQQAIGIQQVSKVGEKMEISIGKRST